MLKTNTLFIFVNLMFINMKIVLDLVKKMLYTLGIK